MKTCLLALKLLILMAFLTGFVYPMVVLLLANLTMPWKAQGSTLHLDGKLVGSHLIGQQFSDVRYFWPRPSATNYNTLPSAASNLGPTSKKLKEEIDRRRIKLAQAHNIQDLSLVPLELICASGSGLDPHISLGTAYFQVARVAKARNMSKDKVEEYIQASLDKPLGKLFGAPHVNVLVLNMNLDLYQLSLNK